MVFPRSMVTFKSTTGPPLAPACTPFTNTLITASGTNCVSVIRSSPGCTGPTCGGGRLEQGSTTPSPGSLGGSPGHMLCVAEKVSDAAIAPRPLMVSAYPQQPHVP